jgi:hypothetical protein
MDKRFRAHLISIAVMLIGVLLSGLFFFLSWIFKDRFAWAAWLPPVSYASFLGAALIAFLIQLGIRYDFARSRVIGFILVIGWIAASLLTTALDALRIVSAHLARGLSLVIILGGLILLVIPGFALMLFPWPPRFIKAKKDRPPGDSRDDRP